ncbi:MAG: methionine--tRNA ligase subunit beta [Candidatus Lokiarchaeota archaeon]|nr:methionine--tRNA ligase subunit beta [Candidatus Lokiarchaeota archaeon]
MSEDSSVSYKDFKKLDIRVGLIVEAEDLEKSDHLLRLKVDIGEKKPRLIIAGLKGYYTPRQLKNKKVIVLANLQPRKMMGLESQGMLLAADVDEKPFLLKFHKDDVDKIPPGTPIS